MANKRPKTLRRTSGSGCIRYESHGVRARPYRAIVTTGWDDTGKQLRKTIGYYKTYDEAATALANYNNNPIEKAGCITFEEVFKRWSEQKYPTVKSSSIKGYNAAYKRCSPIYKRAFKDIGVDDLQDVIDKSGLNFQMLRKLRDLMRQLYQYALPRKYTDQDYSKAVNIEKYRDKNPNAQNRKPFTAEEIAEIKAVDDTEIAKTVLMLIYSGLRISELLNLKKEDCHIDEHYVDIIVSKTKNGIRKVPIADKTLAYWQYFYNKSDSEYLISMDGRDFSDGKGYTAYSDTYWDPLMDTLELGKRHIHETRHTCSTMLHEAEIYPAKINRILGHTGKTTAENVYTHMKIQELIEAINKI